MARICGIDIPQHKRLIISLRYIYGIGPTIAAAIVNRLKIDHAKRVKDLDEKELTNIRKEVTKYKIEGDLRKMISISIKNLMDIGCYRGTRHRKGLPVRGQSSHQNARTARALKSRNLGNK